MLTKFLRKTTHETRDDELEVDDKTVKQFLSELMPGFNEEKRHQRRVSFSRPATMYFDGEPMPFPVMIRDISMEGIGFTHDIPLEPGEVTLRVSSECGQTICARVNILWCREMMRHYYISGGEFIRVFENDPIKLDNVDELDGLISELVD